MYSCVLIHGKIAAATENWWTLHPEEIKLLSLLAITENTGASKDVPIFLPHKSPNVRKLFFRVHVISVITTRSVSIYITKTDKSFAVAV